MLNKFVIPLLILVIAVLGFKLMNTSSSPNPSAQRAATNTAATETSARSSAPENAKTKPSAAQNSDSSKQSEEKTTEEAKKAETPPTRGGGGLRTGVLAKQGATSVEVQRAQIYSESAQLKLFGIIDAQEKATITASSNATVSAIHVSEGQFIEANTLLATLTDTSITEALAQKQSALIELDARQRNEALKYENDKATLAIETELLRIAKNSVDRFSSLNSQQLSSGTDYESALRSYQTQLLSVQNRELTIAQYPDQQKQAQAQRNSLLSQIKQSQELADNLTPTSDFAGYVAKLSLNLGQKLRSGDAIAELYNPESLALYVRVPQRYRLDTLDLDTITAQDKNGNTWVALSIRPINESGAQRVTFIPKANLTNTALPGTHQSLTLFYPIQTAAIEVPITAVYDQQRVYLFDKGTIKAIDVDLVGQTEQGLLISAPELSNDRAMIVTTRIKNPVTGMAVSLVRQPGDRS
jgi:multidrug efflux pump subunit AcrA (membrane-fusion protein)